MKRSDFHYDLPPRLIAQYPLPQRSASRLLVLEGEILILVFLVVLEQYFLELVILFSQLLLLQVVVDILFVL